MMKYNMYKFITEIQLYKNKNKISLNTNYWYNLPNILSINYK